MANGEQCMHCGHEETQHTYLDIVEKPGKRIKGYRVAFQSCKGFKVKETKESKEKKEFEMAWHERQATARFFWGRFAADKRQQRFNEEVSKLHGEDRKRFIEDGVRQNQQGFWIG